MASDNRDWYRDWWRKKTGYVERASFRVSEGDRKRQMHKKQWRSFFLRVFVLFFLFVLAVFFFQLLRKFS